METKYNFGSTYGDGLEFRRHLWRCSADHIPETSAQREPGAADVDAGQRPGALHRSGAGQHQEARAAERRNCRPWETKRKLLPWARPNRPRIPIGGKTGPPRPPSGPAPPRPPAAAPTPARPPSGHPPGPRADTRRPAAPAPARPPVRHPPGRRGRQVGRRSHARRPRLRRPQARRTTPRSGAGPAGPAHRPTRSPGRPQHRFRRPVVRDEGVDVAAPQGADDGLHFPRPAGHGDDVRDGLQSVQ